MWIQGMQQQIPRAGIRMVINKLHVATPDAEIIANWERRITRNGKVTPYQRHAIIRYALAAHHANQQLVSRFRL